MLVTDDWISLDCNKIPVNAHATAHVSRHISGIIPQISAAWDKHPNWATIRDSLVKGAAEAAKHGLRWDEIAHVKHLTSIWEHNRLISVEKLQPRLVWSAQLTDIGDNERTYCRHCHITSPIRCFSRVRAPRMIFRSLQISGVGPTRNSLKDHLRPKWLA